MLSYSKLSKLITSTLKCQIVTPIADETHSIIFLELKTQNNVPILLQINNEYTIKAKEVEKGTVYIHEIEKPKDGYEYILTSERDTGVVQEIRPKDWPYGYIDMVNNLQTSLINTVYKAAVFTNSFIILPEKVYQKSGLFKNVSLMVLVDLETLVKKNHIDEIERIHTNILKIITKYNQEYNDNLLQLLKKCQELKLVSNARVSKCPLEQNIKIFLAHEAIKKALESFY